MCTCNNKDKGADEPTLRDPQKDKAQGQCDFNQCDTKSPLTRGKAFLLNSSDATLKKKLVSGLQTCALEDVAYLFARNSAHRLYTVHLSLPPPLFLKYSSLLL